MRKPPQPRTVAVFFPGVARAILVRAYNAQTARVEAASMLSPEEKAGFLAARERMPPCDQQRWKQWLAF